MNQDRMWEHCVDFIRYKGNEALKATIIQLFRIEKRFMLAGMERALLYSNSSIYTTKYADNSSPLLYKDVLSHKISDNNIGTHHSFSWYRVDILFDHRSTQFLRKKTDRKQYQIAQCVCASTCCAKIFKICSFEVRKWHITLEPVPFKLNYKQ